MPIQNARATSGSKRGIFARVQIGQVLVLRIGHRAEHHALVEPQQVRRAQDDADRRPRPPRPMLTSKAPCRMVNSPMKPLSSGRPSGTEHGDHEDGGVNRHDVRQAAVLRDLARVPPLVDHADDQEEHAGRDAVVDLLDDAAGDAVRVQREDAQRAEAQVADRGVRHQLLPVLLHQADQRAVDDADDREHHQHLHDALASTDACGSSGSEKRRKP